MVKKQKSLPKFKFKHQVKPFNSVTLHAKNKKEAKEKFESIFGKVLNNYKITKV
jgi:3-hydroxymyristoyl/3-hydroxydecanoyl-(acyl carrier protein) dehydratase